MKNKNTSVSEFVQGPVSGEVEHAISNIRDEQGNMQSGNVLRRTCQWAGEGACKQVCQLDTADGGTDKTGKTTSDVLASRACADLNLRTALEDLDLKPEEVLMVGVTANNVGFADSLDEYEKLSENPYGWRELPGFNAFFARESEEKAIGRRLADCADINFELKDKDGDTVFGFEHGTRTNMFGSDEYLFEKNGKKMSFTEYTLSQALEHYGTDPSTVHINLAAAIQGHNFTKHFDSREKMEEHLPGWYDDGYVVNVSNPSWQPEDPVIAEDTWEADTRDMIIRDIKEAMLSLGIPEENFSMEGIIDPGDSQGVHSSHQNASEYGDTRDLYITYAK